MGDLPVFERYIGIDYSGAETPTSRLKRLQVFMASRDHGPKKINTPAGDKWNWTRKEVALWCVEQLKADEPVVIGIDHAFSFPVSYMKRYGLKHWDHFLADFCQHWPTDDDHTYVDFVRENNPRTGKMTEFRLTERWTSSTKSIFKMDGPGSVGKSTHSGIPWLRAIRVHPKLKDRVHFWPFDGFEIGQEKSVVAEVYPSIFRRRYPQNGRTVDEHDAWSVAMWLKTMHSRGVLGQYFNPPLTLPERQQARLEGWILGVYIDEDLFFVSAAEVSCHFESGSHGILICPWID